MSEAVRRAGGALLLLLAIPGCGEGAAGPEARHLVLVSLDTTRADHLGCYGDGRGLTPRIDDLARESIRFEEALTTAPTTLAAHTSMLTGRYPRAHGVVRNGFPVHADNLLLAERLRAVGFRTAAFVASYALHSSFGMDQGFEDYDEAFDRARADDPALDQNQRRAQSVTDAALAFVEEHGVGQGDERWFLFVHYFDAHSPYDAPSEAGGDAPNERTEAGESARGDPRDLALAVARHHREALGRPLPHVLETGLTRRLLARAAGEPLGRDRERAANYAAEVAYLDEHVGRLLDGLRERGILERALTVLTGDHGETFWEHADVWNHGLGVYRTTARVPLLVRLPDVALERRAGTVHGAPVSTVDLLPTILAALELAPDPGLEGVDLLAPRVAPHLVFSEATQPRGGELEAGEWGNARKAKAVVDGRYKYVWTPYLDHEELFDLERDPGERTNLLASGIPASAVLEETRARLREALRSWAQRDTPLPSSFNPAGASEVTERLHALGYGGGEEDE